MPSMIDRPRAFSGKQASQETAELGAFIALLKGNGVRSYGEIGARDGDTFHAVMLALSAGSKGVALDYPGGAWGTGNSRGRLERAVEHLNGKGYSTSCMFGDSTAPATIQQFNGRGPYDAIFIDGDHRLEGVTADWTNYRHMARIVAFHDIDGDGQRDGRGAPVQVPMLWQSIKQSGLRYVEIVTPESHMGIGVVWMPGVNGSP